MDQFKLKRFVSASSALLGASAQLAQRQAELATIKNVTMPKLHYAIGRRVVRLVKLPSDLMSYQEKIRAFEATLGSTAGADAADSPGGLAAKAKHMAHQAAKKTADAATNLQLQAAYVGLGKAAIEKYGRKAVPKEIVGDFDAAEARIAELSTEIKSLQNSSGVGILTPRRIVLVGGALLAVSIGLVLLRGLGGIFGGRKSTFDYNQFTKDVMNSPEYQQQAAEGARIASEATAGLKDSFADLDRDIDRTMKGVIRDGGRHQLEMQLSQVMQSWQDQANVLTEDIRDADELGDLRSSVGNHTRWQMEGLDRWGALKKVRSEAASELRDVSDRLKKDFLRGRSDSEINEDVVNAEVAVALRQFAEVCAEKTDALKRERTAAIAAVKAFHFEQVAKGMQPELTDKMLASICSIRESAESKPLDRERLHFGSIDADSAFGQYYLGRLTNQDIDGLPTRERLESLLACVAQAQSDLAAKWRAHVIGSCRDVRVLAASDASIFFDVAARRALLQRLPAMSAIEREGSGLDFDQIIQKIALASFAYPDKSLAADFENLVSNGKLFPVEGFGNKAFSLLVAGAWQGSAKCIDRVTQFMQSDRDDRDRSGGVTFDQGLVVRLAGAVMAANDSSRTRETLFRVASRLQKLTSGEAFFRNGCDYQSFLEGWFASAGPDAIEDTRNLYTEILRLGDVISDDPLVAIHQRMEYGRIGPLLYLLRMNDQKVGAAFRVEKLAWQSERVALLMTLSSQNRLDEVPIESIEAIVSDPWENTNATTEAGGPRYFATRKIRIDEWLLYARSLKARDEAAFNQTMLDTVCGRTPLRQALRKDMLPQLGSGGAAFLDPWSVAESPMFPYRAWAARMLVDKDPKNLDRLTAWAWGDKEANAGMRMLIACVAAAQEPSTNLAVTCQKVLKEAKEDEAYTRGLLTALATPADAVPDQDVARAADSEFLRGLLFAGVAGGRPKVATASMEAFRYRGERCDASEVIDDAYSSTKRWTPFDFMPIEEACELLASQAPLGLDATADQLSEYRKEAQRLWPSDVEMVAVVTADDVTRVTTKTFRDRLSSSYRRTTAEQMARIPVAEAENWSFNNWSLYYDPHLIAAAIDERRAEKGNQREDLQAIGRLLSGLCSPSISGDPREIDANVVTAWEARSLESIWPELVKMERNLVSLDQKADFQRSVVTYIERWITGHQPSAGE